MQSTRTASHAACIPIVLASILATSPAQAQWTNIAPGIQLLKETRPGPRRVFVAKVDLCAPGVRMRATKPGEGPRTVSSFGGLVGAAVAVNGDWPSKDGVLPLPSTYPRGLSVGDGVHFPGTIDPPYYGFVAFGYDQVYHSNEPEAFGPPAPWMRDVVSGQPTLVWNGAALNNTGGHCPVRHPRTIVGTNKEQTVFMMAVVDGRTSASIGMTCNEAAAFMLSLGAHAALLQDGGGSSTFWQGGVGVLNKPSDGSQRSLVNHWGAIASGSGPPRSCKTREIPQASTGALKRGIPSPAVLAAWKFQWTDIVPVSDAYLNAFKTGPNIVAAPKLIKGSGAAVYLVDANNTKRHVPNGMAMSAWRFDWGAIANTPDATVNAMATGSRLTYTPVLVQGSSPTVWVLDLAPPNTPPPPKDAGGGTTPPEDAGGGTTPPEDAGAGNQPPLSDAGVNGAPGDSAYDPTLDGTVQTLSVDDDPRAQGGCAIATAANDGEGAGAAGALGLLLALLALRRRCAAGRRSTAGRGS